MKNSIEFMQDEKLIELRTKLTQFVRTEKAFTPSDIQQVLSILAGVTVRARELGQKEAYADVRNAMNNLMDEKYRWADLLDWLVGKR